MQDILIANGYIDIARAHTGNSDRKVATILSNIAKYGFALDKNAFAILPHTNLRNWWKVVEPILKNISGSHKDIASAVVYKNFPKEVLEMSAAKQIMHQYMIYMGIPVKFISEDETPREPLGEMTKLKVLSLADTTTPVKIFSNLKSLPSRWSDNQSEWAKKLYIGNGIVASDFGFKENAIDLMVANFATANFAASSATDVLRLSAGLSDGDLSLRTKTKFRKFSRSERQRLLGYLNEQSLEEDFASRPEQWKRLLSRLHPGDYKQYPNVIAAYDDLYNRRTKTFNSKIDQKTLTVDMLDVLCQRPGTYVRNFMKFYSKFPNETVNKFLTIVDKLNIRQLLYFSKYVETINTRKEMMYPPKSNWAQVKIFLNKKKISTEHVEILTNGMGEILKSKLLEKYPEGFSLGANLTNIKFQTNDQKLAEFGRGTVFPLADNTKFIRSASYWEVSDKGTVWYDNGFNFFNKNWAPLTACSWNHQHVYGKAAIMSGDPLVNGSKNKKAGCQIIDLYIDQLIAHGVRYAVWNILCYSHKKFSENYVLGTLQCGENPETGKLYDPARAQFVFPLKSDSFSSYLAYIDLEKREIVYMDAPLAANVSSAEKNGNTLNEKMPPYIEYMNAQPSVYDLLKHAPGTIPALYTDNDVSVSDKAFVFKPENTDNVYEKITLADLLK